ncbi:hypothetical protein RRG08_014601 [Elysia crispata]|uniref:Uncharacterized protein n=1 Tax=Elysia crispata TaxID=231223 RepID=A0AAE0Z2I0_9GAST|nr:hypothetical protein RRG08_014601 [Elysia crispata]
MNIIRQRSLVLGAMLCQDFHHHSGLPQNSCRLCDRETTPTDSKQFPVTTQHGNSQRPSGFTSPFLKGFYKL